VLDLVKLFYVRIEERREAPEAGLAKPIAGS
jgi:hypothetical protein